jgi:hypothetical protein
MEVRAARIGARGAVIAACIAVVATIIGAMVAGSYAISTTNEQIKAQGDQSRAQSQAQGEQERAKAEADKEAARDEFARNQLRAASSTLINDSALLGQAETDFLVVVKDPDVDFSSDLFTERNNTVVDQFAKLKADLTNVLVLDYPATNAAAQGLFDCHSGITDELIRDEMPIQSEDVSTGSPEYQAAIAKVGDEIANLDSFEDALASALQNDLA